MSPSTAGAMRHSLLPSKSTGKIRLRLSRRLPYNTFRVAFTPPDPGRQAIDPRHFFGRGFGSAPANFYPASGILEGI